MKLTPTYTQFSMATFFRDFLFKSKAEQYKPELGVKILTNPSCINFEQVLFWRNPDPLKVQFLNMSFGWWAISSSSILESRT
jgi:hypothetical protein